MTRRRVCLILALCVSSVCGTLTPADRSGAETVKRDPKKTGDEILYHLDIGNPSISQPVGSASGAEGAKFVQVEVARVLNPKKRALMFEVRYQPKGGAGIYLGSFSLYPPDNPGSFIVPTQGRLKNEGTVVLSLVILDKLDAADTVEVGVKAIRFVDGRPR